MDGPCGGTDRVWRSSPFRRDIRLGAIPLTKSPFIYGTIGECSCCQPEKDALFAGRATGCEAGSRNHVAESGRGYEMELLATRVPAARYLNLVMTETATEVLVYDQESHHIHHLNRSSATIWRLCDGERTTADLAAAASRELGTNVSAEMVRVALGKLADASLLDGELPATMRPAISSRRTFMKKAAVAGGIAVPAIVSVTAPTAAGASTPLACGESCVDVQPPGDNMCNSQCSQCSLVGGVGPVCCNPGGGGTVICD